MKSIEIEVLSEIPNASVIQLPWRKFPGIVVQGDTLSTMYSRFQRIKDYCISNPETVPDEVEESLQMLGDQLASLLEHYEAVLNSKSIRLPYVKASNLKGPREQ